MRQITVGIAEYAVGMNDLTLATAGLGSCVAIALIAENARIGALAHVLLPNSLLSASEAMPGKFASTAVPVMLTRMRELGAKNDILARLVGGASMFASALSSGHPSLGTRNIFAARAALAEHGVKIVAEDVGGFHGRSVLFDVGAGVVEVRSILNGNRSI